MEEKSYISKMMPSVEKIADDVIEQILQSEDPFAAPVVVCHNTKVVQWFKAYFLKTRSEILMNVRFETLSVFLNGIINPEYKYTIMDKNCLRDYIIRELMCCAYDSSCDEIRYIFNADKSVNGMKLYDFADKLAGQFLEYEFDDEDISAFGWQYDIYKNVTEAAEKDGLYTTKRLLEKETRSKITDRVFVIDNSFITALFERMLNELCNENTTVYSVSEIENFADSDVDPVSKEKCATLEVYSAPSVLREVEELHSRICKIIKDDKDVRFNDFIVYAPDISEYASAIGRVFKQDGKDYPVIPFRIVGDIKEKKDMIDALSILFDMSIKGFFTRTDFFKFIKNSMVQYVHDFSDEDADNWMDAVYETESHRNGKNNDEIEDDWDYLKKRLLTAILVPSECETENIVKLSGKDVLPFSSMDIDDDSMTKMLDIINMLHNWCTVFKSSTAMTGCESSSTDTIQVSGVESESETEKTGEYLFNKEKIEQVRASLDEMFARTSAAGSEKNYFYRSVSNELSRIEGLFELESIPASTLLRLLISNVTAFVSYPADMFSAGVTFLDFNSDDIVPAKYVYVMGLSSKSIPHIDIKSELNLSSSAKHKSSAELDEISIRNILRNESGVTFSFVNRNLKTGEEYYPSPLLVKYFKKKPDEISAVPLDESRDYKDLFSRKEFKDKDYYERLTGLKADSEGAKVGETPGNTYTTETPEIHESSETIKMPETSEFSASTEKPTAKTDVIELTTANIKDFFKNTFVYKYNAMLKQSEDEEEKLKDEYDLIDDNTLSKYNSIRSLAETSTPDETKKILKLGMKVPANGLEDPYLEAYDKGSAEYLRNEIAGGYELLKLEPLTLGEAPDIWVLKLTATTHIYKKVDENGDLHYMEPKDVKLKENISSEYYLSAYAAALMDIANMDGTEAYSVYLGPEIVEKNYTIRPDEAQAILNDVKNLMTDYSDLRYMDVEYTSEFTKRSDKRKLPNALSELADQIEGHCSWQYSMVKKMVNPYTDLGYSVKDFKNKFYGILDVMKGLIRFIQEDENNA